ncbi:YidB family protein [Mesorhizobium sp.]|uniref:YidB family protein n=1 Tax=Mesorhizobium sp. TaxID=1871066 RepID=UPI000FE80E6B|nr:YidB family protein [Mesorhizobium sp.]RWG24955.1 MAG: DUF937 domain-containing protein [Mesorhizobium sp.]
MGLFDNAVPGGNITKPLMIALGALLVGKMLSGRSEEQPAEAQAPAPTPAGTSAEGGLLDRLRDAGHGGVADSWVGTGQNRPINANDLGSALGPAVIREIAQRTGMNEQELLQQLSTALPGVVDKLTPNGQVPPQHQVTSAFNS